MSGARPVTAEGLRPGAPGIRLERLRSPPGPLIEYRPVDTLVAVATGSPRFAELVPGDGEPRRVAVLPGLVHVFPAGRTIGVRLLGVADNVVVTLGSGLLAEAGGDSGQIRPAFAEEAPLVRELVLALDRAPGSTEPQRRHARRLAAALASEVLQTFGTAAPRAPARRAGPDVQALAGYIDTHVEDDLTLGQLAARAHLSVFSFARRFRAVVGIPPHRYVLNRRVERAKALLVQNDATVAEVALRCGFGDQSAFTTAFRRLTRQTPTRYRETHRPAR